MGNKKQMMITNFNVFKVGSEIGN